MSFKEKLPKKLYFQIAEVAEIAGRATSTIRFWVEHFNIPIQRRTANSKRAFTEAEIRKVLAIKYLLHTEFYTMKGAEIKYALWLKGKYEIPEDFIQVPEDFVVSKEDDFVLEYD